MGLREDWAAFNNHVEKDLWSDAFNLLYALSVWPFCPFWFLGSKSFSLFPHFLISCQNLPVLSHLPFMFPR